VLEQGHPFALPFLSEMQQRLYRRVLREVVENLIDVSSALPGFTEQSFAELLRRETVIIEVAQRVLSEVTRIREGSQKANQEEALAQFEEEYRRGVVRKYDNMELFGIDLSPVTQRYPLSVAYISLAVALPLDARTENIGQDGTRQDDGETLISVEASLAAGPRLLVRGQAGSGKTTLLRWLAVNAARNGFETPLEGWNGRVPFFIALRRFVDQEFPVPESFAAMTVPVLGRPIPQDWVGNTLASGRAVLLIDGVDEVPQHQRTSVYEWLEALIGSFPRCHFVITSRPGAVTEGWLSADGPS
jgi:hypothetical protein